MWQKLSIGVHGDQTEQLSDLLTEAGAVAVTVEAGNEEEIFEPEVGTTPFWGESKVIGLFPVESNLAQVLTFVKQAVYPHAILNHVIEQLEDQDWQKLCTDQFKPICFANKLWVSPSWDHPPNDQKPVVWLDPGLAFGTGAHPTTALCLEWLATQVQPDQRVVDYGCGSGILGVAAIKLGAKECWAVDNDPQALEATMENAKRNNLNFEQIQAVLPEDLPKLEVDLLVANILANPLVSLAPVLGKLLKRGGKIALSGILHYQVKMILDAYTPLFRFDPPVQKEEWVLLSGVKMPA